MWRAACGRPVPVTTDLIKTPFSLLQCVRVGKVPRTAPDSDPGSVVQESDNGLGIQFTSCELGARPRIAHRDMAEDSAWGPVPDKSPQSQ